MKALHPAEHTIKTARAPGSILPTVALACDMMETIAWPENYTKCIICQWPHLTHPMTVTFGDADDTRWKNYVFTNSAVGGPGVLESPPTWATTAAWSSSLNSKIQGYRVVSQSITCEVIAPSVANQGTIVSGQYEARPATRQLSSLYPGAMENAFRDSVDVWVYNSAPLESQLLMGTSAYTSHAVNGFYQPLKLSKFKFVNVNDTMLFTDDMGGNKLAKDVLFIPGMTPVWLRIPTSGLQLDFDSTPLVKPSAYNAGVTFISGTAGHPQVSLRIRFRQVVELIPTLGAIYAPLTEAPLPPDELAFKMVKEIGARMKDAYPASYNDMGKLLGTIKSIGNGILKFADPVLDVVSMIPGIGTAAGAAKLALGTARGLGGNKPAQQAPQTPVVVRKVAAGSTGKSASKKKKSK